MRAAVRGDRALSIEYYSASHDMLSSRVVDPIRVVLVADHSYLEAWCRSAEGVRLFRFDRIVDASVLDEPSAPPEPAVQAAPPDTSLFDADPSLPSATLLIDRSASWMFDYYPLQGDPRTARRGLRGRDDLRLRRVDGPLRARLRLRGAGAGAGVAGRAGARIGGGGMCVRMGLVSKRAGRLSPDVWR